MGTMTRIEKMPREQFDKLFSLAYWYGLQPKFINLATQQKTTSTNSLRCWYRNFQK